MKCPLSLRNVEDLLAARGTLFGTRHGGCVPARLHEGRRVELGTFTEVVSSTAGSRWP